MPIYEVKDTKTGRTLRLKGDSPPTDEELDRLFRSQPEDPAAAMAETGGIKAKEILQAKDKIESLPWYESLATDLEQLRYNMAYGVAEGGVGLGVSIANLFGADWENPLTKAIESPPEDSLAEKSKDSMIRPMTREVTQFAPVSAGISAASKLPKIATGVAKIPKLLRGLLNVGTTEFIAYSGGQENIADTLANTPLSSPITDILTKKDDESELMGRFKNVAQGLAMAGGVQVLGKTVKTVFSGVEEGLSKFDAALRPIKSRIEKISPRVANRLDGFELQTNLLRNEYLDRVGPFLVSYKKFSSRDQVLFSRHTRNSNLKEASAILQKYDAKGKIPGVTREFEMVRETLDDLHKLANDNGVEVAYRRDYLPRTVKDYDGLMEKLGAEPKREIDRLLDQARQRKTVDIGEGATDTVALTDFERQQVIESYLSGTARLGGAPGFAMKRTIPEVTKEMEKFYGTFDESLTKYVGSSTYRVSRNRFTGKSPEFKDSSWQTKAAVAYEKGDIDGTQLEELKRLMNIRLSHGEAAVSKNLKLYRDLVYMTHIGNPYSTLTQFGDAPLNLYRNGLIPTLKGLRIKNLKLKDIGIGEVSVELQSASAMRKGLDLVLRSTGFRQVDLLMKEVNIKGALAKAQGQLGRKGSNSYDDFIKAQKPYFGDETESLAEALAKGDTKDDNALLYLYQQLARTQPISLSEMPESYLKWRGGRAVYFLKSFTVKQLELVRADILRKVGSPNPKEVREGFKNAARLSVYFGGGMTGINIAKDFLTNREVDIPDAALQSFIQIIGISRYQIYKTKREGLPWAVGSIVTPPVPLSREILRGDFSSIPGSAVRYLPIVGKDLFWTSKPVDLIKHGMEKFGLDPDMIPEGAGKIRERKRLIEKHRKQQIPAKPAAAPKPAKPVGIR